MNADPKELLMQYGGPAGLAVSVLIFVTYLIVSSGATAADAKFEALDKSIKTIYDTLRQKNFTPENTPKAVPEHLEQIRKNWLSANVAQVSPTFLVYPALALAFKEFKDPSEIERIQKSLTSRYLVLDPEEEMKQSYQGPRLKIIRGADVKDIRPVSAVLLSVQQEEIDRIKIQWKDDDTGKNTIDQCGLEEYQVYRTKEGVAEPTRISPAGYKEQTFIDSNFEPRSTYTYYVVTKALTEKITEKLPPIPPEAAPSNSIAIQSKSDVGILFYAVIGGGGSSLANVTVYKYFQGTWYRKPFQMKRGDIIGKPSKVKLKDGTRIDLDFTTPYEVYEYSNDEERVVQEGGKEVRIPKQARLFYFDVTGGKKVKKEMWKFHSRYDQNPYESAEAPTTPEQPEDNK